MGCTLGRAPRTTRGPSRRSGQVHRGMDVDAEAAAHDAAAFVGPKLRPRPSTCAASRARPSAREAQPVFRPRTSARSLRTVRAPAPWHDDDAHQAGGGCFAGHVCLRPALPRLGPGMPRTASAPAARPIPASSRLLPASAAVLAPAGSPPAAPTPYGSSSVLRETSGCGIAAQQPDISTLREPDISILRLQQKFR